MIRAEEAREKSKQNFHELVEKQARAILRQTEENLQNAIKRGKNDFVMYISAETTNQAVYAAIKVLNDLGYNTILKYSPEFGYLSRELKVNFK